MATDVSPKVSPPGQGGSCAPLPASGEGTLGLIACDTGGDGLRLSKADGSLRTSTDVCVTATLRLAQAPPAGSSSSKCAAFTKTAEGWLQLKGRDSTQCLTETTDGKLAMTKCVGAHQAWTTVDSITGAWDEPGSHTPMHFIEQKQQGGEKSQVLISFDKSQFWSTANCSLSAEGKACDGGHFSGGSVGSSFPTCIWNASVAMPHIQVASISAGCKGCCAHTLWTKRGGGSATDERVQSSGSGNCLRGCGGSGGPAVKPPAIKGRSITPQSLFPVPPAGLSFVATTFGQAACLDGAAASRCILGFSTSTPLDVYTGHALPSRNWKVLHVAPVLAGGWVVVGEQAKYVAMSPQRVVAAVAAVADDPAASDGLDEGELMADGKGVKFVIVGADKELAKITVVAPAPGSQHNSGEKLLDKALGGKIIVVSVTLGPSGRAEVTCAPGGCTVS